MSHAMHRTLFGKRSLCSLLFACLFASSAQAAEGDIASMVEAVKQRLANEEKKQAAIIDGEDRALLCKFCHGKDGNSLKPNVPNLAGQNPYYLLEQIEKFATRERDDYVMSPLAAEFSPEDKVNIAIFYYSNPVKTQVVDGELAEKGETLFRLICSSCHGTDGRGNEKFARLAGQKMVYVESVLKGFRQNATNPDSKSAAGRKSKTMEGVAKKLTDTQIQQIAAYVAQLP